MQSSVAFQKRGVIMYVKFIYKYRSILSKKRGTRLF